MFPEQPSSDTLSLTKIGRLHILKVFRRKKTKGPEQDSQNHLRFLNFIYSLNACAVFINSENYFLKSTCAKGFPDIFIRLNIASLVHWK